MRAICLMFWLTGCSDSRWQPWFGVSPELDPKVEDPEDSAEERPDGTRGLNELEGSAQGGGAPCGERVSPADTGLLERWPYLQLVAPNEATVVFGTLSEEVEGVVEFGATGSYTRSETAGKGQLRIVDNYLADDTALPQPSHITLHHARLSGLPPGQEICYRVLVDGQVAASGLRFKAAPSSAEEPVSFVVIGDWGSGTSDAEIVRDSMAPWLDGVSLFFTTGDNAYQSGDWDEIHENVFGLYEDMWMELPVYPTPGNHDYATEEAKPYFENFFLPRNALREGDMEAFYSMQWGVLHFIGLNTETPARSHDDDDPYDQLDWLKADLAAADRPWKVAAYHKPAYSGHPHRSSDYAARYEFGPLLQDGGAQLVLAGHNHFYERFTPLKDDEPTEVVSGGVTYVTTAGGGRSLYDTGHTDHQELIVRKHHFVRVDLDVCTMRIRAIGTDGSVLDDWTTTRCE